MTLTTYRPATDADAADLIRLVGTCFADYAGCLLDIAEEEPVLLCFASSFGEMGGETCVAVSPNGKIVGMIAWSPKDNGSAELKKLYVDPDAQRQGIGKTLVTWVIDQVEAAGRRELTLWTDTRFGDAHRLYERQGFIRQPEVRELYDISNTSEAYYILDLNRRAV